MDNPSQLDRRLLMVAASKRDERHARRMLREAEISVCFCESLSELADRVVEGAGAVAIHDRILRSDPVQRLFEALSEQPNWSALPTILITSDQRTQWFADRPEANATILRQPVHVDTLLSVIRTAIEARERQYLVRDLLQQKEETERILREADRRKDEFLATLAHELRNPISPITNALDLMDISDGTMHDEVEIRGIMRRQVQQLTRLVDDLLDVSRITRGKIRLDRKLFDIRDAVKSGLEESQPFIRYSKQKLNTELGGQPLYVNGDPARLAQCVANLLNNAAKYTPAEGSIRLKLSQEDNDVKLTIADSGIGIPSDKLATVFELFEQHDTDQERGQAGLGIGLTLVKSLLELHSGTIEAQSEGLNKGSKFTLRLPLATEQPPANRDLPANSAESQFQPRNVLVVEDTAAIRFILKRLLEKMGHQVTLAVDGIEGLRLAKETGPDIIFSDISMPVMGGLQFVRQLRLDKQFELTPVIAMTGYGRSEDQKRTLAAGFDEHLTKPVDVQELKRVLDNISSKT